MNFSSQLRSRWCAAALAAGLLCSGVLQGEEQPMLRVVFGPKSTVLSGLVDSETTKEALLAAVKSARPDLKPDARGLQVSAESSLPSFPDLRSLLDEIALSTHEGRFELWPERIVIGGLTDSQVTQSILKLRAEPLLRGRQLQSELKIVSSDDLPKIDVALSHGKIVPTERIAAGGQAALTETPFEAPGLRFDKLLATLHLLANPSRLGLPAASTPAESGAMPLRALPLDLSRDNAPAEAPLPPEPDPYEALPSVWFSRNTFLLQANQVPVLDSLAASLIEPKRLEAKIRIEALQPPSGSSAFNEYLCERRGAEVARLLVERGLSSSRFLIRSVASDAPVDTGEVRLLVEILPPAMDSEAEKDEAAGNAPPPPAPRPPGAATPAAPRIQDRLDDPSPPTDQPH